MTALDEALSDADTQEPVKPQLQSRLIPESDDDEDIVMIRVKGSDKNPEKKSDDKKAAGKASRVVERIPESDHSDDEQQTDPPVDFGEEEEDEEELTTEKPDGESATPSKHPDPMECDGEGKKSDNSSNAEQVRHKGALRKDKDVATSQSPTKTKKTKAKELSPSKTIKKSKVELKTKSKAVKGRQTTSKKATQVGKTKEKKPKSKSSSAETNAQSSKDEQQVPKKTSKSKPLVRKAVKPSPKGEKDPSTKQKSLKVKKQIGKEDTAKEKKSPIKKKTKAGTPVTTYSKKAKKVTGQQSKASATERKKSGETVTAQKKTLGSKATKTSKTAKKDEEQEVSETSGDVQCESENEEAASDSDSMTDELARTPAAKLKIIGNLACSSRDPNAGALLDHAVQQLGRYNIVSYNAESNVDLKAYIIGNETKRGWGLLQALVSGVPLVSENWLSGSISEGKWIPMNAFRSDRFGQSPRSVASAGEAGGKLLDGLRIKVVSAEKDASSIRKIIRLCGARLAETRVDLVIVDSKKKIDDACPHVQKKWLADSIEAGAPLEYEPYSLG